MLEMMVSKVAPGLRVGRGLEPIEVRDHSFPEAVAPGLRVGRGLELRRSRLEVRNRSHVAPGLRVGRGLELQVSQGSRRCLYVAPGLRVGRGLELEDHHREQLAADVAPGLRVGRGLELRLGSNRAAVPTVAPGLRVGRGLEQPDHQRGPTVRALRLAYGSGEDWHGFTNVWSPSVYGCVRSLVWAQRVGLLLVYKGPVAVPFLDAAAVFVLQNVTFTEWAMLVLN